jgi:hypothetical protein
MKNLIPLIFAILPLACASAPRNQGCEVAVDQVSIEYKGIQKLSAWGKESPFGAFVVSSKAAKEIKLPLDATHYPLLVHGRHVELQSRPVASNAPWGPDTVVLEEFFQPRKWLVIGSGAGTMFFVDMVGPVSDGERSSSLEYRVSLKDASGCEYLSQPFRINP